MTDARHALERAQLPAEVKTLAAELLAELADHPEGDRS